ncbi:tyrosine-type recombinase/integrase [Roseibium sp. M-1]
MRLYDRANRRLYINAEERERIIEQAERQPLPRKALCLTLLYTGCRISEALALTTASVDSYSHLISIRTLKKRNRHQVREVPVPTVLTDVLTKLIGKQPDNPALFLHEGQPLKRITAYRWIKHVMTLADIKGLQACPKGLRHGYGVHALRSGVPLNMLRKWMGHSSIETTAIYANAVGKEEMEIAGRMWAAP